MTLPLASLNVIIAIIIIKRYDSPQGHRLFQFSFVFDFSLYFINFCIARPMSLYRPNTNKFLID